ncbi:hypothetical protein AAFF_G00224270 [Aldrovandia affinis]|uniref:ERAP1-like C-terminal domain-containing protein n=1 Tax=Aldrovandia affinis TaxID=143900 RepID=A0AAD7X303_9TELE|nr:hypothetical protein AAFF_G00224270 [Aldrovandia affinis]
MISTVKAIAKNVVGQYLVWDFVRSQWPNITQTYRTEASLGNLLDGVTSKFSTEFELQQIMELQEEEHCAFAWVFKQPLEKILFNIEWVEEHKQTVHEWFQREISLVKDKV